MKIEDIQYLRDLHPEYKVMTGEGSTYANYGQYRFIVWDDVKELMHSIRHSATTYLRSDVPIEVVTIGYDAIESIVATVSKKGLSDVLDSIGQSDNSQLDLIAIIKDTFSK